MKYLKDKILNDAKDKFRRHRYRAFIRNIEFQFTFEEWYKMWLDSGHWEERGCKRGEYCMARKRDIGPYSKENVLIQLSTQNNSDGHKGQLPINKGQKHTIEARQKISAKRKGRAPWNKGLTK